MDFFGSGLRAKVFLSLVWVSDPGFVSFTGSGFKVRVLDFMLRDQLVSLSGPFTLQKPGRSWRIKHMIKI